MSDIDPVWRTTGDDDVVIPTSLNEPVQVAPMRASTVSRRPAAIVGIFFVLGIGFLFMHGYSNFTGQISSESASSPSVEALTAAEVTIGQDGFEPKIVNVKPGQEIVWTNTVETPQILLNDEIKNESGQTLYTPVIFQNEKVSFVVSLDQKPGDYVYVSTTEDTYEGTIHVEGETETQTSAPAPLGGLDDIPLPTGGFSDAPLPSNRPPPRARSSSSARRSSPSVRQSSSSAQPIANQPGTFTTGGNSSSASSASSSPILVAATTDTDTTDGNVPFFNPGFSGSDDQSNFPSVDVGQLLPHNPYTVGSTSQPLPSEELHQGAPLHKPVSQPTTGPGLWIVSLVSIAVLFWFTRKSFRIHRAEN